MSVSVLNFFVLLDKSCQTSTEELHESDLFLRHSCLRHSLFLSETFSDLHIFFTILPANTHTPHPDKQTQTCTQTHTQTHTHTHKYTHTCSISLSLSYIHMHTRTHPLSHTRTQNNQARQKEKVVVLLLCITILQMPSAYKFKRQISYMFPYLLFPYLR